MIDWSAYRGELPRLLDARGDALRADERAFARALDRLVAKQGRARLDRNPVVEVVPFEPVLLAHRLVDPALRPSARLAHVLAQALVARRELGAVAVARRLL